MLVRLIILSLALFAAATADEPSPLKRCELLPLPGQLVSFQIDGVEKTRWNFGSNSPRPFFHPFNGPSGTSLTRIGHPGASNHDHHLSVWFAHHDVNSISFWADSGEGRIRQQHWSAYRDGNDEAIMAVKCNWQDGAGKVLMQQDLIAALIPVNDGEHAVELQITFRPGDQAAPVELGKTNFGFLAVRMAKTASAFFGGGKLTNSEGAEDEPQIFGKPARWMDYSGPVAAGTGRERKSVVEGITYFDHPTNPRYPTHWHVREDGWMGASFCMQEGYTIRADSPLTLRYLLHAHSGSYDHTKAEVVQKAFSDRPGFEVVKAPRRHNQYDVQRKPAGK